MKIFFQSLDWYHCQVYRRRFFIFYQLIATATLDLENNLLFELHTTSHKVCYCLPDLTLKTYQFMIYSRENS